MNKSVKIAMNIVDDYRYVYDPEHTNKPNGNWKYTASGWSNNLEQSDDSDFAPSNITTPTKNPTPIKSKPEDSDGKEGLPKTTEENENLFSDEKSKSSFVTDEDGKKEEVKSKSNDSLEENPDEDEDDDEFSLDVDDNSEKDNKPEDESEDKEEEEGFDFNDEEDNSELEGEEEPPFNEDEKEEYLSEEKYEEYLENLNAFIDRFDESEGKDNNVTFKAVASNLDWDSDGEVKAFLDHCNEKKLEGAHDALAFLYFYNKEKKEKFDKIIEEMK